MNERTVRSASLGLIVALWVAVSANAALTSAISVSPAVVMLRGTPGQTTTQTLTVTNGTSDRLEFTMMAKDVVIRQGRRVFVDAGEEPGGIAASATFSRPMVTVEAGQTARVDMTVTVPVKPTVRAVVGLFHGTTKIRREHSSLTASIGTLLTFTMSDDVAVDVSALTVKPPTATGNLTVLQHLVNRGREPAVVKAMLAIINGAGALIGKEAIPPHRLLPGEQADIQKQYGGELPPGHYRALVTCDIQGKTSIAEGEFDVR